jgi:hypothetical protein
MFSTLLLSALVATSAPIELASTNSLYTVAQAADHDAEIDAAGDDVEKILELGRSWKSARKSAAAKAAFLRVLELDPENEEAHKGLRHHFYAGQWFTSYSALSKYKRAESEEMKAKGLSRLGDEWVPTADLPFLKMGWAKDESGNWVDPFRLQIAEYEAAMAEEGRELRAEDSSWIHPDDFDKWSEGLWKCGDKWVSLSEANAFHSKLGQWWQARGERFELLTTCDMEVLLWARWHADQAYGDLSRVFGLQPSYRPMLVLMRNIEQFNTFAAGSQADSFPAAESSGYSSLHNAYFADSWFDPRTTPPRFLGTGVGYWDASDEKVGPFGKHSVRHAAGLAYAEAIAPSLNTLGAALAASAPINLDEFWAEKPIPRWLFYGAAAFAERYYKDVQGEGDPMKYRAWSIANLRSGGDLDSLESIFAFNLSLENIGPSTRLINEAGLVVSFIVDGGCGPVIEAHRAFKSALKKGSGAREAVVALQKAVIDNKEAFEKYVESN